MEVELTAVVRHGVAIRDDIAMPTPGYLCVGAAESLLRLTDRFELEQIGEAFVYVKKGKIR